MDQCMIALPKAYNIGEKVTLIGKQNEEEVTIDEWAAKVEDDQLRNTMYHNC
ncbi:hypothetical protein UACE39S_05977 [Ureibacillus acetophenoni]